MKLRQRKSYIIVFYCIVVFCSTYYLQDYIRFKYIKSQSISPKDIHIQKLENRPLIPGKFMLYLDKYKYILNRNSIPSSWPQNKKVYLWQLWLQGIENAPEIVKLCMKTVRKFNYDKEYVVLDSSNLSNYIDIPDYIKTKYEKGLISHAHYSDIIRVMLLEKYGGIWMDATIMQTAELPPEIFENSFFVFQDIHNFDKDDKIFDGVPPELIKKWEDLHLYPKLSNWFIYAEPNNRIISLTKQFLLDYWKNEDYAKDYFLFHLWIEYVINHDKDAADIWKKMPPFLSCIPNFVQFSFNDDIDYNKLEEMYALSPIHKLTYKKNIKKENFDMIFRPVKEEKFNKNN